MLKDKELFDKKKDETCDVPIKDFGESIYKLKKVKVINENVADDELKYEDR